MPTLMPNGKSLRVLMVLAFVCALLTAPVPSAIAQSPNASVSGRVTDQTNAVIPNVEVEIKNVDTGVTEVTKTNSDGIYSFPSLAPGQYIMNVRKEQFQTISVTGIMLNVQDNLSRNFMLQLGSSAVSVTVRADSVNLNTTNGAVGTVIDHAFVEEMPLNGNSLQTLFELVPGVVTNAGGAPSGGGGFSVNGQRPTSNYVTVDGASGNIYTSVSVAPNVLGAGIPTSASGGTNGLLPVDAIEEFRMQTSSYSAEFGRTPGGQVQVRTRAGTNAFHGSVFENFRNQVLDAQDWFNGYYGLKQSPLRMNDFGGTLGGPIVKDRIFFFFAHESLLMNQPQAATSIRVPSETARTQAADVFQPYVNSYPAGNAGPDPSFADSDVYKFSPSNIIRDHSSSGRLDAELSKALHAFFRVNDAPSFLQSNSVTWRGTTNLDILSLTGGMTWQLSPTMLDELTLNHSSYETSKVNVPDSSVKPFLDAVATFVDASSGETASFLPTHWFSLNSGQTNGNNLHQWNLVNVFKKTVGHHLLTIGLDYRSITPTIAQATTLQLFTNQKPTSVPNGTWDRVRFTTYVDKGAHLTSRNTSLFVADTWRVRPNLTLDLGLRWELNPPPTASSGPGLPAMQGDPRDPSTITLAPNGVDPYETRYSNFAPRVGVAYSVRNTQRYSTVLRAGVGIFYDTGQATTGATSSLLLYPYRLSTQVTNIPYASLDVSQLPLAAAALPQFQLYLDDPHLVAPRTYQWSLTVDQQLGATMVLSTSYVGNHGDKLIRDNTFSGLSPSLASTLDVYTNDARSSYNALQIQLRRNAKRLSALTSYTFAHALDNGSSDFAGIGGFQRNDKANSDNDIRHIFSAAITYAPQGFQKNRFLRALTDGWSLNSIVLLQSAAPLSVFSFSSEDINTYNSLADLVPGVPVTVSDSTAPGGRRLNSAAFTSAPSNRDGNTARNGYRLFGLHQFDLSVGRTWRLMEKTALTFRVDAFNVLNTPSFWVQDTNIQDLNFGIATATYAGVYGATGGNAANGSLNQVFSNGGARSLQLSLKIKF